MLASVFAPHTTLSALPTSLGRGLVASTPVTAKDILLQVDWCNMLCVSDKPSRGSAFGRRLLDDWQALHGPLPPLLAGFLLSEAQWATRLAAWLLWLRKRSFEDGMTERGESGNDSDAARRGGIWGLYLQLLPTKEEMTCLMNYTEEELPELQLPYFISTAKSERRALQELHESLFACAAASSTIGSELSGLRLARHVDDSIWAMSVVNSRCFSESIDGEAVSLMVPCADMANHAVQPRAEYRFEAAMDAFQLVALQHVPMGEEVCISYGCVRKTNAELMKDYGFVLTANLNDRVPFQVAAGAKYGQQNQGLNAPSLDATRLMKAWNITASSSKNGSRGLELVGESSPEALLSSEDGVTVAARRRVVTLLSVAPFLRNLSGEEVASSGAADEEIERERWSALELRDQCHAMLAALPTTLEEDLALYSTCIGENCGSKNPSEGKVSRERYVQAVAARLEAKQMIAAAAEILDSYARSL
jgi:hypothetical protein